MDFETVYYEGSQAYIYLQEQDLLGEQDQVVKRNSLSLDLGQGKIKDQDQGQTIQDAKKGRDHKLFAKIEFPYLAKPIFCVSVLVFFYSFQIMLTSPVQYLFMVLFLIILVLLTVKIKQYEVNIETQPFEQVISLQFVNQQQYEPNMLKTICLLDRFRNRCIELSVQPNRFIDICLILSNIDRICCPILSKSYAIQVKSIYSSIQAIALIKKLMIEISRLIERNLLDSKGFSMKKIVFEGLKPIKTTWFQYCSSGINERLSKYLLALQSSQKQQQHHCKRLTLDDHRKNQILIDMLARSLKEKEERKQINEPTSLKTKTILALLKLQLLCKKNQFLKANHEQNQHIQVQDIFDNEEEQIISSFPINKPVDSNYIVLTTEGKVQQIQGQTIMQQIVQLKEKLQVILEDKKKDNLGKSEGEKIVEKHPKPELERRVQGFGSLFSLVNRKMESYYVE